MDKKSIIGIVVIALLFAGFTFYSSREQKRYQQELAQWQAYQDSVAAASAPASPLWPCCPPMRPGAEAPPNR